MKAIAQLPPDPQVILSPALAAEKSASPGRSTSRLYGVLAAFLLLLLAIAHLTVFWVGPFGKDGLIYASLAFLDQLSLELGMRYLHVYGLWALYQVTGSMLLGAGLFSLLMYLGIVAWAYWVAANVNGPRAGLIALLLTACYPVLIVNATVPLCDLTATCLSCLAVGLVCFRRQGAQPWSVLMAGVLVALSARCRDSALLTLIPILFAAFSDLPHLLKRLLPCVALGLVFGLGLSVALDGAFLGRPGLMFEGRLLRSYSQFVFRPHDLSPSFGPNLTDIISQRWNFAFGALALAGVISQTVDRRAWTTLVFWSACNALYFGMSLSAVDFAANERYVLPVLVPLFPLAGCWLDRQLEIVLSTPRLLLWSLGIAVIGVAVVLGGSSISPSFFKKSFHQFFPVAWLVAIPLALAPKPPRVLSLGILFLTVLALFSALFIATETGRNARQRLAHWQKLVTALEPLAHQTIYIVAASDEYTTEAHLRVYSNHRISRFQRLTTLKPTLPSYALVDHQSLPKALEIGYKTVERFESLTYGDMWLVKL